MPSLYVETLPVAPLGTRPFPRPPRAYSLTRIQCAPAVNCDGSAAAVLRSTVWRPPPTTLTSVSRLTRRALVYSRVDPVIQATDVWVKDLRSGADRQVTSDSLTEASALWSPDGDELIYRSNRGSLSNQLYRVSASGVGRAEMVLSVAQQRDLQQATPIPTDWSQSGAYLVYHAATPKYGFDLWALSLADRKAVIHKQTLLQRVAWLDLEGFPLARLRIG